MKILLGWIFSLSANLILAQTIVVTDEFGDPISETIIALEPQQIYLYTQENGVVQLPSEVSYESLKIYHSDYETQSFEAHEIEDMEQIVVLYQCSFNLDEIVISASKFLEKKTLVPQYINTINKQEIVLQNSPTTAEILSNSGKVFVQKSQQGGGSPNVRGFEANKVLLVVDGVRMNNAIFRAGHLQNVINTDANSIEKVEVLYGSGSVMYGSDALGGVININTEKVELSLDSLQYSGKAYARHATSNSEKTAGFLIKLSGRKIASLTSFNYSDFGDLRQGSQRNSAMGNLGLRPFYAINNGSYDQMIENTEPNVQKFSGYQQYNFLQKLKFKTNEFHSHQFNFQFTTSSDIPRYDRLSEIDDQGNQKNAEWYYGPQKWMLASYHFDRIKNTKFFNEIQSIIAYQKFEESRHSRKFNVAEKRNQQERVDVLNFNLNMKKIWRTHDLKYGLEAYYNKVRSEAYHQNIYTHETSMARTRYPDGGSYMGSIAAYLSHQQHFGDKKYYLSEGLRYTYTQLESTFEDQTYFPFAYDKIRQKTSNISGFIGFVYLAQNDMRWSLNLNSGFRTPNIDDVGKVFDSTPGNVILPNPNLKPEKTIGADLSFTYVFAKLLKLETVLFYTSFRDIITTQNSSYLGNSSILYDGVMSQVQQQQNAGKAYLYGFNCNADAKFNSFLSFKAQFTFTKGEVIDDENYPLDHIPPFFGKLNLQYKKKKWFAELYTIFNAKKPIERYNPFGEDNEKYATPEGMPAWWTLNIKTTYKAFKKGLINLGVENILDRNYRVFASGISAPGRNFVFSFQYHF